MTKDDREYFFEWKYIVFVNETYTAHKQMQMNFSRIPKSDKCLFDRKTICKKRKTMKIIKIPNKSDIDWYSSSWKKSSHRRVTTIHNNIPVSVPISASAPTPVGRGKIYRNSFWVYFSRFIFVIYIRILIWAKNTALRLMIEKWFGISFQNRNHLPSTSFFQLNFSDGCAKGDANARRDNLLLQLLLKWFNVVVFSSSQRY